MVRYRLSVLAVMVTLLWLITGCNLTSTQDEIANTPVPATNTAQSTATNIAQIPTSAVITSLPPLTQQPPTSFLPPTQAFVTSTPSLISIAIVSPAPGSVLAGNIQVVGSAIHPNFLQYQLEFGPDPNPSNLWFPIGSARLAPVLNNLLGVWSTAGSIPDGVYQLRMRVFLRDGNILQTSVNNLTVRNTAPTPIPTNTPNIPRPQAAFDVDVTSGFAPLTVRFTDQSSGTIDTYSWNFGDGGQRSNRNPRYTFRTPGVYDVRLTVSGPGGRSNFSRRIIVQGSNPPVANFNMQPSSGPAPLTVQFTDTSTGDLTGHLWTFGDGVTTTERSPRHTFQEVGDYNVILEVRGRDGSSSRITRRVRVVNPQVQPPVADFTPRTQTGDTPLRVEFRDTSTGQIDTYEWDFGDGTTSTDRNPIHQYENPGTYTVTLTVSNRGGPSTATGTITANRPAQAPVAAFEANPTTGNAPLNVQFTDRSTGTVTQREWNFGDGQVSAEISPAHTFIEPGTYTVRLTLLGEGNTRDTAEVIIRVTEPVAPPVAAFDAVPTEGTAPLTVEFTNQSTGDGITSRWDFGDGNRSDSQETIVTHTYALGGSYTVTLTVSGPGGADTTATRIINVGTAVPTATPTQTIAAPTADFTFTVQGFSVSFVDASTGEISSRLWDFGDGVNDLTQLPTHTYAGPGTYNVTLTVSGPGGENSITKPVTVQVIVPPPQASFEIAAINGMEVTFRDLSTGAINTWQWDFDDGTGDVSQNPVHTYANPGTYNVTLTVTGEGGSASTTLPVTVQVIIPPPQASFEIATINGLEVTFRDLSTGAINTWQWDFGDGTGDVSQNPVHTYANPGTYNVTLTVTGDGGSSAIILPITLAEEPTPEPEEPDQSIADTTSVLPDIGALADGLRPVYRNGGKRADVFAVVGGREINQETFLRPFGDGSYTLGGRGEAVRSIIEWYSSADVLNGQNSFARTGAGIFEVRMDELVNNDSSRDGCEAGENALECELRLTNAAVVVIGIGFADARQDTDSGSFRGNLQTLIDTALNNGVIPVLMTPYPRADEIDRMRRISEVIIETASDNGIPVLNVFRLMNELPSGMAGNAPAVAPAGADVLDDRTLEFGENARTYHLLRLLADIRSTIF